MNEENQYVLAVFDPLGKRRGFVVRADGWSGNPPTPRKSGAYGKARTYMDEPSGVQQSWYRPTIQAWMDEGVTEVKPGAIVPEGTRLYIPQFVTTIVLVEDQLSAMKVAQAGAVGVALLGTNLTFDKVYELQQARPTEVIVALDADASQRSFDMVRNFSPAFRSMRVALLQQDIKDLPMSDVTTALGLSA